MVIAQVGDAIILNQQMGNAPGKIAAMWKRLNKHKDKIFLFLKYPDKNIPPENNAAYPNLSLNRLVTSIVSKKIDNNN
ncbi:hypothetical protein GCM10027566_09640 [Arachidicoccus ginsenosidivorans]|jgi:hypothetical protein